MSAQSVDELINTLADKVGEKAKADFKASALMKIQEILLQPTQAVLPQVAAPIAPMPVTASPMPTPKPAQLKPEEKKPEVNDALTEYLKKKEKAPPPQKSKRQFDLPRILIVAAVITLAVAALVIGGALGQTTTSPSLTSTPDNSNIIQIYGVGFNTSTPLTLQLLKDNATMYNFNANITTDANGSFSCLYIIPTSLSGAYTLTATAGNTTAQHNIVVPDLRGADGLNGTNGLDFNATGNTILNNGTQGIKGPKGDQGIMGNSTAGIVGVGLSIAALVIVVIPRKKNYSAP